MGAAPGSVLVLLAVLSATGSAQILQPPSAEAPEGAPLNLTCAHSSINTNDNVFWYRQFPDRGLQFIVSGYKGTVSSSALEGALHISADRRASALALRRAGLGDSAVYYCALSDTVRQPEPAPHKNPRRRRGGAGAAERAEEAMRAYCKRTYESGLDGSKMWIQ